MTLQRSTPIICPLSPFLWTLPPPNIYWDSYGFLDIKRRSAIIYIFGSCPALKFSFTQTQSFCHSSLHSLGIHLFVVSLIHIHTIQYNTVTRKTGSPPPPRLPSYSTICIHRGFFLYGTAVDIEGMQDLIGR